MIQYVKFNQIDNLEACKQNFRILYDYVQIKSLHDKFCYLTVLLNR